MKYEKALTELRAQVRPDEQLVAEAAASSRQIDQKGKQGNILSGALVLTNKRLCYLGTLLMERSSFAVPVQAITSIDHHRQALQNYTMITVQGGVTHRFLALPPALLAKIDEVRFAVPTADPSSRPRPEPAHPASGLGDLERLVEMRTAGHLSDAEFTAAKAKLLGL